MIRPQVVAGNRLASLNRAEQILLASRAAELARMAGATVIALSDRKSRLARLASIFFPCDEINDPSIFTPMSSRLAHLALLDALQVALALAMGETAVERLRRSREALA